MKRAVILLLAFVIFLFPVSVHSESSDSGFSTAKRIADDLESQYGITILIGPECTSATTGGFTLGDQPSGRSPLLNLLGEKNYESEIGYIERALSQYSSDLFSRFHNDEAPNGFRILLADQIVYEGESMAGVATVADGYYNIFLGVGAFQQTNIHHEIWHAAELRIRYDNPSAFDGWNDLNPEGFRYLEDAYNLDKWEGYAEKDEYFVRGYSTLDEMEDRATIAEALFRNDAEWWAAHPGVTEKYRKMKEAAEPQFGSIYPYDY